MFLVKGLWVGKCSYCYTKQSIAILLQIVKHLVKEMNNFFFEI
jgi:hypothetical protein